MCVFVMLPDSTLETLISEGRWSYFQVIPPSRSRLLLLDIMTQATPEKLSSWLGHRIVDLKTV